MKPVYTELHDFTGKVRDAVMTTEKKVIEPVRVSFLKKFPILGTLLVTFGVSATFFGMEPIITDIDWLNDRPFLIFFLGIVALVVSGKLYQKLG